MRCLFVCLFVILFHFTAFHLINTQFLSVLGTHYVGGMTVATDTLYCQAFGSTNKKEVGVYVQKALMICLLFVFPTWIFHLNAETILHWIGIVSNVSRITGSFLLITLPVMILQPVLMILLKWMRCQNIVAPLLGLQFCGLGINVLLLYVLVDIYKAGVYACALAYVGTYVTWLLTTFCYIYFSGIYKKTWPGWTRDAFQDWSPFVKLGVWSMVMIQVQWWLFEIGTLLAGTLGKKQLAAQSILFQIEIFSFQCSFNVGSATNMRLGYLLGADDPVRAKRALIVSNCIICVESIVLVTTILALKDVIPILFSSDIEVQQLASSLIPYLALYNLFDCICSGASGTLRGCGKQFECAVILFISLYLVGLPISLCLMSYTDLQLAGFWIGCSAALFIGSILFIGYMTRIDWKHEAALAQVRANAVIKKNVDENTGLLQKRSETYITHPAIPKLRMCSPYNSSQPDLSVVQHVPKKLPFAELLIRRLLAVAASLTCLVLALILKVCLSPTWVDCIPRDLSNGSSISVTSYPNPNDYDNGTLTYC